MRCAGARLQVPRSAAAALLVAVDLEPVADASVRAGSLAITAYGKRPSLLVRTAEEGQHKTAVALLRSV